jgi:hypothetical protein
MKIDAVAKETWKKKALTPYKRTINILSTIWIEYFGRMIQLMNIKNPE